MRSLTEAIGGRPTSLLEMGAGAGNNAWHYKHVIPDVTLSDLAPRILALSDAQNPGFRHVLGDMRTLRLGRAFDAVFIHDAISYLTTEVDLRQALETAWLHCDTWRRCLVRAGRRATASSRAPTTAGTDGPGRALRYREWVADPDPIDQTYAVDDTYLLHAQGERPRCVLDRHVHGLFAEADWLRLMGEVGFEDARGVPFEHSEEPPGSLVAFTGRRGRGPGR